MLAVWGVTLLIAGGGCLPAQAASTRSAVVFNTACASCHEGECSGRLSFAPDPGASRAHVQRHYPPAKGDEVLHTDLFFILSYMKEQCAYYPMETALVPGSEQGAAFLDQFSSLPQGDYFIPLGRLSPGTYRLLLELDAAVEVEVQLVSGEFETLVEDCYQPEQRRVSIPFRIEQPASYYFRLYPERPVRLLRFGIR